MGRFHRINPISRQTPGRGWQRAGLGLDQRLFMVDAGRNFSAALRGDPMSFGALTWLWLFPLLGGILVFFGGKTARTAKLAAAIISLGPLVLSLAVAFFPGEGAGPLSEVGPAWGYGMRYALMADGLSLTLCWLTAFLTVVSLLASWNQEFPAGYWACFLFLEAALMGVFLARDLFLFFIFWEAVLVPMFFIIGLWGSEGRRHAAMKFSLFTFFGSIFLLLGILGLVTQHHQLKIGR